MCPEARRGFGLPVAMGCQSLVQQNVCEDTRLGKSVHALLHLKVYVSIGDQWKKGILCDDFEGNEFDWDA
jgi:hypothetical protein